MYSPAVKRGVFVLEGLNSFGLTYFFYYFYFFTQQKFGFDNKANLVLAAGLGFVCMVAAIYGGRFAQRAGYFAALKVGFFTMLASLSAGLFLGDWAAGHIALAVLTTTGMCFTWATLEALISEGESYATLPGKIGFYNVIWAGTGALAYFCGGAILEQFGLRSLYSLPIAILIAQLVLTHRLEQRAKRERGSPAAAPAPADAPHPQPPAKARAFLRMAWLANPFSYIAINTLVAVMPGIAQRLELSTTLAGVCGSLWCFARVAAFLGFWFWTGWHYRFRWLLAAFLALIGSFAVILLVPNLTVVILAQLLFGAALGLTYYSSLFYSMDVGETKGEHGGIHEAAIGLGNLVGPAVGAASLHFLPGRPNSGAVAVTLLLVCGLAGLLGIWRTTRA
jgi:predicted MFS family arabinose efflux permease